MSHRHTIAGWLALLFFTGVATAERPPNFILIFCDDLGYGDLGCFGSKKNRTPHIDGMARDGIRFTSFYSSSPVCTPSRASLLTGCYPRRIGLHEDFTGHWVLIPRSRRGFHPEERTLPEALKAKGYATACIGKWHLGDQPEHLPTRHGFDRYYGIPYSNDMQNKGRGDPPLPLVDQEKVIEQPADQATLTKRYTEQVIAFIETHRDQPFFIYLPHTFPHLPLFASKDFHGKSQNGRYGDTVEEIDGSTGQILDALKRLKLTDRTLVMFTSDNGSNGRNGGSNRPLAGAKGSTMEGGMRVPMIAQWPGRIPAGTTCDALTTTMDILPTFSRLAGAESPEKAIDGFDIGPLLLDEDGAESPYEAFYYYRRRQLQAIRMGDWKYHLPLEKTYPRWFSVEQT
ncbi:MAG: sulfatase, partial [Verrucomicrobiota bacterium]